MPIKNAYICDECGKTGITDDEDQDPTGLILGWGLCRWVLDNLLS